MYRAVALFALQNNLFDNANLDQQKLINLLEQIEVSFTTDTNGQSVIMLNGREVEAEIREMRVSEKVSEIATIPEVRKKLVSLQQKIASKKGVVMDGRDIGTNVMPDAEVKLFMTARPEVRAQRRFEELKAKGKTVTFEDVLKNLRHRDELDSTRAANPLRQADDAIAFDNSDIGLNDQFDHVLNLITQVVQPH